MIRAWLNRRSWRFWMYLSGLLLGLTIVCLPVALLLLAYGHQCFAFLATSMAFALLETTDLTMKKWKP